MRITWHKPLAILLALILAFLPIAPPEAYAQQAPNSAVEAAEPLAEEGKEAAPKDDKASNNASGSTVAPVAENPAGSAQDETLEPKSTLEENRTLSQEDPLAEQMSDEKVQTDAKTLAPTVGTPGVEAEASKPHVAYHVHRQTYGWETKWARDGAVSGTTGQAKRLESIELKLEGASGGIRYRTHVQSYGWVGWSQNGAPSGTTGQAKRLEAIRIELTGDVASKYDVWYRVHAQTYGWMGWAKNGANAGTATYAKRLEAIQIVLLPKGSSAPSDSYGGISRATASPYVTRLLQYKTHVQTFGWQDWRFDGAVSGTSGLAKRLEAINIAFADQPYSGDVEYCTHVQTYGWLGWKRNGAMSGTSGQAKRMEAIRIQLTGQMAQHYDIWYRVHAQTFGWMGWTKNGNQAGTAGLAKRLEAIQIVLTAKGAAAPSASYGGVRQATSQAFSTTAPGVSAATPARGPSSAGNLSVRGAKLVDQKGNAVQLRGISTHGLAWFPGYVNDACFKQLRRHWNANVVRLAMYTEEYGGYCSGGNKSSLTALVKKGVQLAASNDLYAIVDWHILSDGNPNRHVNEAKAFFADMSATFRNNNNIIYEICNEPNGGTSWNDIKQYANQIIPVIRKNDPDAVIIVGTPTWSQEVDKAAASPLSQGNVMYALHFYAATHKDDLRNCMVSAVRSGLPIFVSEFGICDASGNGAIDQGSANSWITTMNSLGISWCMWSLCNKAESASAIKSSCNATSGFGTGDLTTSGTWLLRALNGTLPAGTDSSAGNSSQGNTPAAPPAGQTATFTSGSLACKAVLTNSWPEGSGKMVYQYDLSITNKGGARSSWSFTLPFNSAVSYVNGWNATFVANGSRMSVSNASYNGSLAAGATIAGIGVQVRGPAGLVVKP